MTLLEHLLLRSVRTGLGMTRYIISYQLEMLKLFIMVSYWGYVDFWGEIIFTVLLSVLLNCLDI